MKIILTLFIFIVAFYLAAMMFRRLTQTAQQLADLRSDLAKSDAHLQVKLAALQAERETTQANATQANATQTNALRANTLKAETSSTRSDEITSDDQFKIQN